MSFRFTVVESSLNRAEFRWKWLRLVQHSSVLGMCLCLLALLTGGAIYLGWITSKVVAIAWFASLGVGGVIAGAVVFISAMAATPDRLWLGAAIERIDRRLLDRLNTLLFLERRRGDPVTDGFALRISRQAQQLVNEKASPSPFSSGRSFGWLLGFLAILLATVWLFQVYSPWHTLLAAQKAHAKRAAKPELPVDLTLPTNNVEASQSWGEVRIVEPGADLKVTKVDVVPLQIEAASSRPLKRVEWMSAVNGEAEIPHSLPPTSEPRYAVYQPTIYLDELHLSDWDVLTYYARSSTEPTNSFASQVYFLEVRPFREDILKTPGGEKGVPYRTLNEMSSLIDRQQHVIRQTHQHIQTPVESENVRNQDRKKLADAEEDLGGAAQHLYARMAAEMENQPIGEALDNLAQAQKSLAGASHALSGNLMPDAQGHERSALAELVSARKVFQKAVSDNPSAFQDGSAPDDPAAVADTAEELNQMTEFRNEAKASQEFVQKTLEQQQQLEQRVRGANPREYQQLGSQQHQLQSALKDFQGQHPALLKGSDAALQAMSQAADSLQNRSASAPIDTQQATRELAAFSQAMQNQSAGRQLADAYKLKQMLDQQIQTLGKGAQDPSQVPTAGLKQTARDARQTVNQLKKSAEQEPTRDAFGQPLRDALSGENKVALDAKLMQLEQPSGNNSQQLAAQARDALAGVSHAFEASQPRSTQIARNTDTLKPDERESFSQGIAELESLIKQLEQGGEVPDQAKQGRQALANLQAGLRNQFGNNERGEQLLLSLDQMLKADTPLDVEQLEKLAQQLQHFSVETSEQLARKADQPQVNNIDPARLPPAYRGRIQKYFQKLSED